MSTYDALPYTSLPYPRTHPDHLAAMARVFGARAADVERCRVLEIGCGSAGNLLAMAEGLPRALFVGVDPSVGEIERGQALASELGVDNLRLVAGTADDVEGPFDFVIAHGVLSWVPEEVRRGILRRARALLAERGVFYGSYNVHPGFHLREAVRGMLRRHVQSDAPRAQLEEGRALMDWLSRRVGREGGAYRAVLDEEIARLAMADESYLFHELLEEHNHALWFTDFAREAGDAGLAFLCEADPAANTTARATPRAWEALSVIAGEERVRVEQHFDFLRGRSFRASLLVRDDLVLGEPDVQSLHVASRGPGELFVEDPTLLRAFAQLAEAWPDALPVSQLGLELDALAPLHAASIVELRARALRLARPPFADVKISPLARKQAEGRGMVVNLRHEPLPLTAEERRGLLERTPSMLPRLASLALLGT